MKVTFNQQFTVCFRTYKTNQRKLQTLLAFNNYKFTESKCIFESFYKLEIECKGIKRLYLLKLLLENEKIVLYE